MAKQIVLTWPKWALVVFSVSLVFAMNLVGASDQQSFEPPKKLELSEKPRFFSISTDAPQCVERAIGACVVSSARDRDRCFEALRPLCSRIPAAQSQLCAQEFKACTVRYERRLSSDCPALHFEAC